MAKLPGGGRARSGGELSELQSTDTLHEPKAPLVAMHVLLWKKKPPVHWSQVLVVQVCGYEEYNKVQ